MDPGAQTGPIGPKPYDFTGFGTMAATKPYEFIGFGAMDATKPYEFIGFGAMASKPIQKLGGHSVSPSPHTHPMPWVYRSLCSTPPVWGNLWINFVQF